MGLWEIEDSIRILEKNKNFEKDFIDLARSVYITNDKRFQVKNEINNFLTLIMSKKNHTKITSIDLIESSCFFTWDYSLKTWNESGTIDRELTFFKKIEKDRNVLFSYFTYGKSSDVELASSFGLSEVNPIYSSTKYYKNKLLRLFSSFLLPFKFKNKFDDVDLIFQNQLLGCWVPILIKKNIQKAFNH